MLLYEGDYSLAEMFAGAKDHENRPPAHRLCWVRTNMVFTAIDFETANHSRVSICAAGLATFVNGVLTEAPYRLVRPPRRHGWFRDDFIECHGLTHLDVREASEFSAIAPALLGSYAALIW
jgi:DNA polymerase III epsilon subunit-like protein